MPNKRTGWKVFKRQCRNLCFSNSIAWVCLTFSGVVPELVSHPVHLKPGSPVSAFIPFCAFEGKLRISESRILPNLTFPTCQSFRSTSLDGQLCYKIGKNRRTKGSKNREGFLTWTMTCVYQSNLRTIQRVKTTPTISPWISCQAQIRKVQKSTSKHCRRSKPLALEATRWPQLRSWKGRRISLPCLQRTPDFEECRRRSLFEECQCVPWELGHIQVLQCFKIMLSHF